MRNLRGELAKVEVKIGARGIDFFIQYMTEQGIKAYVHRFTPDRFSRTGSCEIDWKYPYSFRGLQEAREQAIIVAKDLYSLSRDMPIVEIIEKPQEKLPLNKIYRVSLHNLAQTIWAPQRAIA